MLSIVGAAKFVEGSRQMKPAFPKQNNLEWLRLLLATQVVIEHAAAHIGFSLPGLISNFPGVPAFFFVSGFLIYSSYLNAPGRRYFENRFLRLYPGLVAVTIGGAVVALLARGWSDLFYNGETYAVWFIAQTTLGQAFNPGLFREVGVGVINGSLWTITTEILFYLCVPVIAWLERRFAHTVIMLLALSFVFYAIGPLVFSTKIYRDKTVYDLFALTPVAWGWMFAAGILAAKNFDCIRRFIPYAIWAIAPMALMIAFGSGLLFGSTGNRLGLVYFLCYVGVVLWFAFTVPFVRLKFDLSYGAYIWHMPVINFLLVLGIPNPWLAVSLTYLIATLSWFLVEKPALKRKRLSLKPVD